MAKKTRVVSGTADKIVWWLEERKKKLREHLIETMTVNPFLLPILVEFHSVNQLENLVDLLIGSHLMTGHNTGFGKLMDEKILPEVFGTHKLDAKYRKSNPPFAKSCFDEVDHVISRPGGKNDLLSLKAGKWTIQLTMAVQLNAAFKEILDSYPGKYNEIAVGVFYGKSDGLTDKYDILRGINRGKRHAVHDLQTRVHVYAGRDFWAWLNGGERATQDWVLEGIQVGLRKDNSSAECATLLATFRNRIVKSYEKYVSGKGEIDWAALLKNING